MSYDLRDIGNFIFTQKSEYKKLNDEDKEKFFFIMNRKFARRYPKQSQFLNEKSIDKASALDIWYNFFTKHNITSIPDWYWFKLSGIGEKRILKKEEEEFFLEFYELKKHDLVFLMRYFPTELEEEVEKFRRFNK
jgi:hypothetical protein